MVEPSSSQDGRDGCPVPVDSIIVDPADPGVREFIGRATLDGLIRTLPAGEGRTYIIPIDQRRHPEATGTDGAG